MVNRIPQIFPKKVTELHTIKKGASPFHSVGFTEYLGQKERGEGKSPKPQPIFGSRIVKKKWGCEGCRESLKNFLMEIFSIS
jgi:hypothetical protein